MEAKVKILLVEDTLIIQKVTQISLEEIGYEVHVASTGEVALNMAIDSHYDIILMDIGLEAGTDGFIVTKKILEQSELNKNTPIIALTAHDNDDYKERAKAAGMKEFMIKPMDSDRIKEIIKLFVS